MTDLKRGDKARTPFEPSAIVEIVEIEKETVIIRFLTDHGGYEKGSLGRYYLSELTKVNESPTGTANESRAELQENEHD